MLESICYSDVFLGHLLSAPAGSIDNLKASFSFSDCRVQIRCPLLWQPEFSWSACQSLPSAVDTSLSSWQQILHKFCPRRIRELRF